MKISLITGVAGQDGSYLAELLIEKGYYVYGLIRRSSLINTERISSIINHPNFKLCYGDMNDNSCFINLLSEIKNKSPSRVEIYNLAAQSDVKISFDIPEYTAETDGLGTLRILESIRGTFGDSNIVRFYQASTSELYGKVQEIPQKETTPFYPRSPYGVAKLYSYWIVKNYREAYGMYACNGILFNHESKRRGFNFVTRKITIGLGDICRGIIDKLKLGNIDSIRDWGHSKDYVEGMWLMLQQNYPDDYVLSTGEGHTVREFIEISFKKRDFDIKWKGTGVDTVGYDSKTGRELIIIDSKLFRPTEVDLLIGDSSKARRELGWIPKISFDELITEMVNEDC
jgi:GDPmannose 4,6-dehydratase